MDEANEFICSGNDAVELKIVRKVEEIDSEDGFFSPDMCHQVFGQSETIYGYKNLKIQLIYDALNFYCYVKSSYDSKVKPDPVSGLEPEDFMANLESWIPADFVTSKDELKKKMESQNRSPQGEIISEFKVEDRDFEVRLVNNTSPGYAEFHNRIETLIVWYIDAANYIDVEDTKWRVYMVYEKVKKSDTEVYYYSLGYSTVYEYFAFPDKHRYRISQFIIFPPYQFLGLGTEMLKAIYKDIKQLPKVQDITVEEPSEKFQTLRDFVDIAMCKDLPSFDPKLLKNDFNKNMVTEAKETFKFNEKQIRRIYEILRLSVTDTKNSEEYKKYKAMVKQRLSAPFARQEKLAKRRKLFQNSQPQVDAQEVDHHESIIEKEFNQLIGNYQHVIQKTEQADKA